MLCSVLDGVRASGNNDVCVKMQRTHMGMRQGTLLFPVEEEVESAFLKLLSSSSSGEAFNLAVEQFNANIAYSGLNYAVTADGLFVENKEKLILQALQALLAKEGDQSAVANHQLESQFHALRRLVASKAGYEAFTNLPKLVVSIIVISLLC